MPISRTDFEQLEPVDDHPHAEPLYEYLAENNDYGFTADELSDRLNIDWETVTETLTYLHDEGQVQIIGPYWTAN